jgi:hypothetical protein
MHATLLMAFIFSPGAHHALAGMMQPTYVTRQAPAVTGPAGGTYTLELDWTDVAGVASQTVTVPIANGTTRRQAADRMVAALNGNPIIAADWTFRAIDVTGIGLVWVVRGTSNPGRNSAAFANSLTNMGIQNLAAAAGVDPLSGTARFKVTLDGTPRSSGDVDIGIAGINDITTPTTNPDGTFKDVMTIENDLLQGLRSAGFSSSFIDASAVITVPNVSTGDPEVTGGVNDGALFFTTATGSAGSRGSWSFPSPAHSSNSASES